MRFSVKYEQFHVKHHVPSSLYVLVHTQGSKEQHLYYNKLQWIMQ